MLIKSSVIIGVIIATLLTSGISTADPAMAGDRNCDVDISHPYCTGEEGAQGMIFCDLAWSDPADYDRFGDCYDRDFSRIDCGEHPGHSRCGGFQGRDGLIFCDKQYEDMGFKENCFDRNDNPKEYCDNYAIDESDRWYKAEFCQSICDNYQEVIGRGELCSN
ncbi:MAG: hypothetical protein WA941_15415 [Nitrososphaeraceae archaeon]